MKVLSTEQVAIASLKPYPGNARTHDLPTIVRSLERNGQYRAVVVQAKGMRILAGHGTVEGATELGWDTVLAHLVECTAAEAKRIVLVDNRANDLAGYDNPALAQLLEGLAAPALEGTGYGADDVDRLLRSLDADGGGRQSDPGARPAEPRSKPGDVVELGNHRLMCGDARDSAQLAKLMGGETAELVWTDPPYGVALGDVNRHRGGHDHGDMEGDAADPVALLELVTAALAGAAAHSAPGAAVYVCHSDVGGSVFRQALAAGGWELHQVLVWVKQQHVLGRQDYQWKHEPILYGWKPDAGHRWYGGFDQSTVIDDDVDVRKLTKPDLLRLVEDLRAREATTVVREDRPHVADLHPTSKPVELCARLISNSTRLGQAVLDPFGGSGSTLIACENLGRRAYLMEIDPGYCDVIIDRYHRHVDGQADQA